MIFKVKQSSMAAHECAKTSTTHKKTKQSKRFRRSTDFIFPSTRVLLEWMCLINTTLFIQHQQVYSFFPPTFASLTNKTAAHFCEKINQHDTRQFTSLKFSWSSTFASSTKKFAVRPRPGCIKFCKFTVWKEPHLRSSRAVFSGYTALLPRTGMWYLISFQNLQDGERSGGALLVLFWLSPSSLKKVRHFCRRLPVFHQHTAPCLFLRLRTDSGNVASWAGLISSSSTRTTCGGRISTLALVAIIWTSHWGEIRQSQWRSSDKVYVCVDNSILSF